MSLTEMAHLVLRAKRECWNTLLPFGGSEMCVSTLPDTTFPTSEFQEHLLFGSLHKEIEQYIQ